LERDSDKKEKLHKEIFEEALALEFSNPAYFAVHHLTVLSYYLQNNLYSDADSIDVYVLLADFCGKEAGSETAAMNTIADVRVDTPENYCSNVREWAITVIEDIKAKNQNDSNSSPVLCTWSSGAVAIRTIIKPSSGKTD
jgi:hypothetical protein